MIPASDVYSPVMPLEPSLPFLDMFSKTAMAIAIAIAVLLNISKKGKEGSKGITGEYTSEAGIKRTAKRDRSDHIV